MTIKLIRMWSGEDVIADVIEENEDTITMENPIVAVPSQQPGQIAFAPWSPLHAKEKIKVTEKYVVYMENLNQKLLNNIIQCMVRYQLLLKN